MPVAEHAFLASFQQRVIKMIGDRRKAGDAEVDKEVDTLRKSLEADSEKLKALVQDGPGASSAI